MTGRMLFDVVDGLRLEVERALGPGEFNNLAQNPSGEFGGWGWVTPLANSALSAPDITVPLLSLNLGPAFLYRKTTSGASYLYTEALPMAAGEWVAAVWESPYTNVEVFGDTAAYYRARFQFLDSAGAVLSSSAQTALTTPDTLTQHATATYQAPASTVAVRLRFDFYTSGGANPTGAHVHRWIRTTVATAATAAALAGLDYADPYVYEDVTGVAGGTLQLTTEGLSVGALSGNLYDTALDPATSDTIRPGRRVRLSYLDGSQWRPLHHGKMFAPEVEYQVKDPQVAASTKAARIGFTSTDAVAVLAGQQEDRAVGTVDELPFLLEGKGVPWNVNGSGAQITTASVLATTDGASVVDQVAIVRDTALGYAWVDRYGVLQVWDNDTIGTTVFGTDVDEDAYSEAKIGWDTANVINEVMVTVVRTKGNGETVETIFGPYRDDASCDEWGVYPAEYRIVWDGVSVQESQAATLAAAVLTANATPSRRITSVQIPIRTAAERATWCALGVYALVQVVNAAAGIDETMRVMSMTHRVDVAPTVSTWTIDLELATPTRRVKPRRRKARRRAVPYVPNGKRGTNPYASRTRTTTQTIPNTTWSPWVPGSLVEGDTDLVEHDGSGQFTILAEGLYLLNGSIEWTGNATGRRQVRWAINNTAERTLNNKAPDSTDYGQTLAYIRRLEAGDTVKFQVYQGSGGNLTTTSDSTTNGLQISRIGD